MPALPRVSLGKGAVYAGWREKRHAGNLPEERYAGIVSQIPRQAGAAIYPKQKLHTAVQSCKRITKGAYE